MSTAAQNRRALLRDLSEGRWHSEEQRQALVRGFAEMDGLPLDPLLKILHNTGLIREVDRRSAVFRTVCEILCARRDEAVVDSLLELSNAADGHVHDAARVVIPKVATRRSIPGIVGLLRSSMPGTRTLGRQILVEVADRPHAVRSLTQHIRKQKRGARIEDLGLLCQLAPESGVELAAELYSGMSGGERVEATKALATCPPEQAGPVLASWLADTQREVRLAAAEALGSLQYRPAVDTIADMLGSEDPNAVDRIVRVLSHLGDDRSELHMVRLLRNGDNRMRVRAMRTLAQVGGPSALAPLVALVTDRKSGLATQAREALMNIIQRWQPPVMARTLELCCAREPGVAGVVQELLRHMSAQEALPPLMAALRLVSWGVREQAAERICRIWSVDLTPFFYRMLADPDANMRRFSVDMLGRLEIGHDAVPHLLPLLDDDDWWVRERAVEALGRSGDRTLVPRLVDLLETDPELQCATASALGELGDAEALAPLLKVFEAARPDAQIAVVQALGKLEGNRAFDILQGLHARAEKEVRWAINEALLRMQRGLEARDATAPALDRLLLFTQERGGTDLFVPCDGPPLVRKNGKLVPALNRALTPEQSRNLIFQVLTEEQRQLFEERRDLDFSYEIPHRGRFRGNVFVQRNGITAIFRVIPNRIPAAEDLGLPEVCYEMAETRQGLILVTGAAGSGKSTTLASLINHINNRRPCHIITLEHPIEFIHENREALVTQREIGVHARGYHRALRAALRQDPDVVMVGELMDYETVRMAITAAETGHVVFGTLNTQGAVRTVDRIVNFFSGEEQAQARTMLADVLRGVISQQLVWRRDGTGRVAAIEILLGDYRIAKLIRDHKSFQIPNVMAMANDAGMTTMDQSLQILVEEELITPHEGWRKATDRKLFEQYFDKGELPTDQDEVNDAAIEEALRKGSTKL